jgi:hypothetical protein
MQPSRTPRSRWLFAAGCVAALAAASFAGGRDTPDSSNGRWRPTERAEVPAETPPPAALAPIRLDLLARREHAQPSTDLFSSRSWEESVQREARRAVPAGQPPPPSAPPLPFRYLGRLVDGDRTVVFLTSEDRNYIVRAGDTLESTYAVEAIEDDRVVLTYLPLRARQSLQFADTDRQREPAAAQGPPRRRPARDDEDD